MKMKSLATFFVAIAFTGCDSTQNTQTEEIERYSENCQTISETEVSSLFDRWNQSLQTEDPDKVVENYAVQSILLPTVSNEPRLTQAEKKDYFNYFLENKPSGIIDLRFIELGCNMAVDAGLYSFTFAKTGETVNARYSFTYHWDGSKWLITSHHSSAMPEP